MRSRVASSLGLCGAVMALAAGVGAQQASPTVPPATAAPASASLTLGGSVILTLRSSAGGMTPQQRVDSIDARLSDLLGTPDIKPADVTVYTPTGKAPVIYALGRKLITVDTVTAKGESGNKTPLQVAEIWAKRLQQVLPRVNWRPSNEAEPVIPPNPPLTVTNDLSQVGGNIGLVTLRNKVVLKVLGPQSGGMTAQERADMLSRRLQVAANRLKTPSPGDVSVVPVEPAKTPAPAVAPAAAVVKKTPGDQSDQAAAPAVDNQAQILVGTTPIITVDDVQAQATGYKSAELLANAWAKNIRTAMGMSAVVAPSAATPPPAADASSVPPAVNSPTPNTSPTAPAPAAAPSSPVPGG